MNFCRACGEDFGSVGAFDAHRIGKHAYTFAEGFHRDPPREDGRRCLDADELVEVGWHRDQHGRWRQPGLVGGHWANKSAPRRIATPPPDPEPISALGSPKSAVLAPEVAA